MIETIIGIMDGLIGMWIIVHMFRSSFACHCPMWRRWSLYFIAVGFIYQALRHLDPDRFSDNVLFAFVHVTLWVVLLAILWRIYINRRQTA